MLGGRESLRGSGEDYVGVSSISERKEQTLMGVVVARDSLPGIIIWYVLALSSKGISKRLQQKAIHNKTNFYSVA